MFSRLPGFEVKRSGILDVSVTDLLVCAVARLCCTRGSTELRSPDACVVLSVDVGSFWSLMLHGVSSVGYLEYGQALDVPDVLFTVFIY